MKKITGFINKTNEFVGWAVSRLTLALVAVTAWDVFARYVFRSGSVALQELEWHIFSVIFLLSAGYALRQDAHVRVDVIYAQMGKRGKAIINLLGALFFLLPFCAIIMYTSAGFVEHSWMAREGSADPGGLPARYILKSMIITGFFLLALQGVSQFLENLLIAIHPDDGRPEPERVED